MNCDPRDTVTYSLGNNPGEKFAIGKDDGVITVAGDLEQKQYTLAVRAEDTLKRKGFALMHVEVGAPAVHGEWGVLHHERLSLYWVIPGAERVSGYEYRLYVYESTGFQVNKDTSAAADERCNWQTPPDYYTGWVDLGGRNDKFLLVRCKLGAGNTPLYFSKRPKGSVKSPAPEQIGDKIKQAWHQHDHQAGYRVDSNTMGAYPKNYKHVDYLTLSWTQFEKGVEESAKVWNDSQSSMIFEAVTASPNVDVDGYWNPTGGADLDNPCDDSIACTTASSGGSDDYPHLKYQKLWVEFPPQFDAKGSKTGDTKPKQWTNDFTESDKYRETFYYLPHIMMHELGHIAGLGHAHYGNIMGTVKPGKDYEPIEKPTDYDQNGMKHIYQNHNKD